MESEEETKSEREELERHGGGEEEEAFLLSKAASLSVETGTPQLERREHPRVAHSTIVFLSAFISSVNYCIVLPTCRSYASELRGGPLVAGLIIGGADLISIPVTFLLPSLTKKSYAAVFIIQSIFGAVGNVLYGIAGLAALRSKFLLVFGRILAGSVCSYSFTCPNFIGAFVHERHRTNYMTFLYTSVYTGVALGPILGAALASPQLTNFLNRFGKAFNQNNLPGYFMAIVWLLMLAIILLTPKFPNCPKQERFFSGKKKINMNIAVCIIGTGLPAFLDSSWETAAITIMSGYVLGAILLTILLANSVVGWLSYRMSDRLLIGVSLVLLLLSSLAFFDFGKMQKEKLWIAGGLIYMPTVSIISACFSSLTTKLVEKEQMMFFQFLNGTSLQLCLFLAAIYGTLGLDQIGLQGFVLFLVLSILFLILCFCITYKQLKPTCNLV